MPAVFGREVLSWGAKELVKAAIKKGIIRCPTETTKDAYRMSVGGDSEGGGGGAQ